MENRENNQSDAEIFLWDDNLAIRKENICYQGNLKNTNDWPWEELDYFFPSPGINLKQEFFVKNLKKYKTKLMSDISLFEDARGSIFPSGTLVAITGTNGKSSTAIMLYEILKNEGRDVRLAGNIGIPILSLKPGTSETIYIIEMSSFQIELTENIKPENYDILKEDLESRTGLKINHLTVGDVDFVKDTATILIHYNKTNNEK